MVICVAVHVVLDEFVHDCVLEIFVIFEHFFVLIEKGKGKGGIRVCCAAAVTVQ